MNFFGPCRYHLSLHPPTFLGFYQTNSMFVILQAKGMERIRPIHRERKEKGSIGIAPSLVTMFIYIYIYIFDNWERVKERNGIFILTIMPLCLNKELLKTFLSSQICPYLGGKKIPQIGVYFSLLILSFPYLKFSQTWEKNNCSPIHTKKEKTIGIVFSIPLLSTQIPSPKCTWWSHEHRRSLFCPTSAP